MRTRSKNIANLVAALAKTDENIRPEAHMTEIDETDRRILRILQDDASIAIEQIAKAVSLSTNSAWRRIKRLEQDGVIRRRVALLDPEKIGVPVTVFVAIRTNDHSIDWLKRFNEAAALIPEIVEIYRMAGETDYMLKLYVRSVTDYDRVYKQLIQRAPIGDVSASFAMEAIKNTSALPV
jgi:Lrp/AsnC family transcriptional regulator